MMNFFI